MGKVKQTYDIDGNIKSQRTLGSYAPMSILSKDTAQNVSGELGASGAQQELATVRVTAATVGPSPVS